MIIDRCRSLEVQDFEDHYLVSNRPVIVVDAIERWPGPAMWNPEHLFKEFGNASVQIYNDLFTLEDVITLDEYFTKYWRSPVTERRVPYVRWYSRLKPIDFAWADEAFARMSEHWAQPYFLPDSGYLLPVQPFNRRLSAVTDAFPAKGIFISAAGARTALHKDPWCSDAVLCQVYGTKRFRLYNPAQD